MIGKSECGLLRRCSGAVGQRFNLVERQMSYIDQLLRRLDVSFM